MFFYNFIAGIFYIFVAAFIYNTILHLGWKKTLRNFYHDFFEDDKEGKLYGKEHYRR